MPMGSLACSRFLAYRLVTPLSSRERAHNRGRGCLRPSRRLGGLRALGGCLRSGGSASARLTDTNALTLTVAKQLAAAVEEEAVEPPWNGVIILVDDGGPLRSLQQAQTAVTCQRPSKALEEALVTQNRPPILTLPGAMPVEGGVPMIVNETVMGAMGVSGVTVQQEGQRAKAGADALAQILEPEARSDPRQRTAVQRRLAGATGGGLQGLEEADARHGCSTCGLAQGQREA